MKGKVRGLATHYFTEQKVDERGNGVSFGWCPKTGAPFVFTYGPDRDKCPACAGGPETVAGVLRGLENERREREQ